MRRGFLAVALFAAGCEGGVSGTTVDARVDGDGPRRVDGGGADPDGPPATAQELVVKFTPKDRIPGALGGTWDAEVTRARLVLAELVVVGDTAPGDERTRLASVPLVWGDEETVDTAHLPDAPLGRYSRLEARFAAIQLVGTLGGEVDGPFEIDVAPVSGWTFAFSFEPVTLAAGRDAEIDVEVDLRRLVDAIQWGDVEEEGGTLTVETGSEAAEQLRREADEVFDAED